VKSLDDTPDIFRNTTTPQRDVGLRTALKNYLQAQGAPSMMRDLERAGGYTLANVADHIAEEDLQLLDVFDIFQNSSFSFYMKRRRCIDRPEPFPASTGRIVTTEIDARRTFTGAHPRALVMRPLPTTPIPTPGHEGPHEEEIDVIPDSSTYKEVLHTLNDSVSGCLPIDASPAANKTMSFSSLTLGQNTASCESLAQTADSQL